MAVTDAEWDYVKVNGGFVQATKSDFRQEFRGTLCRVKWHRTLDQMGTVKSVLPGL